MAWVGLHDLPKPGLRLLGQGSGLSGQPVSASLANTDPIDGKPSSRCAALLPGSIRSADLMAALVRMIDR